MTTEALEKAELEKNRNMNWISKLIFLGMCTLLVGPLAATGFPLAALLGFSGLYIAKETINVFRNKDKEKNRKMGLVAKAIVIGMGILLVAPLAATGYPILAVLAFFPLFLVTEWYFKGSSQLKDYLCYFFHAKGLEKDELVNEAKRAARYAAIEKGVLGGLFLGTVCIAVATAVFLFFSTPVPWIVAPALIVFAVVAGGVCGYIINHMAFMGGLVELAEEEAKSVETSDPEAPTSGKLFRFISYFSIALILSMGLIGVIAMLGPYLPALLAILPISTPVALIGFVMITSIIVGIKGALSKPKPQRNYIAKYFNNIMGISSAVTTLLCIMYVWQDLLHMTNPYHLATVIIGGTLGTLGVFKGYSDLGFAIYNYCKKTKWEEFKFLFPSRSEHSAPMEKLLGATGMIPVFITVVVGISALNILEFGGTGSLAEKFFSLMSAPEVIAPIAGIGFGLLAGPALAVLYLHCLTKSFRLLGAYFDGTTFKPGGDYANKNDRITKKQVRKYREMLQDNDALNDKMEGLEKNNIHELVKHISILNNAGINIMDRDLDLDDALKSITDTYELQPNIINTYNREHLTEIKNNITNLEDATGINAYKLAWFVELQDKKSKTKNTSVKLDRNGIYGFNRFVAINNIVSTNLKCLFNGSANGANAAKPIFLALTGGFIAVIAIPNLPLAIGVSVFFFAICTVASISVAAATMDYDVLNADKGGDPHWLNKAMHGVMDYGVAPIPSALIWLAWTGVVSPVTTIVSGVLNLFSKGESEDTTSLLPEAAIKAEKSNSKAMLMMLGGPAPEVKPALKLESGNLVVSFSGKPVFKNPIGFKQAKSDTEALILEYKTDSESSSDEERVSDPTSKKPLKSISIESIK